MKRALIAVAVVLAVLAVATPASAMPAQLGPGGGHAVGPPVHPTASVVIGYGQIKLAGTVQDTVRFGQPYFVRGQLTWQPFIPNAQRRPVAGIVTLYHRYAPTGPWLALAAMRTNDLGRYGARLILAHSGYLLAVWPGNAAHTITGVSISWFVRLH